MWGVYHSVPHYIFNIYVTKENIYEDIQKTECRHGLLKIQSISTIDKLALHQCIHNRVAIFRKIGK